MNDNKDHKYILGLQKPYTIENLSPLVGLRFPIRKLGWEWGKRVIDYDEIEITNVKCDLNINDGITISSLMIYSDYYKEKGKKFNAWTDITSIQEYIKEVYKEE